MNLMLITVLAGCMGPEQHSVYSELLRAGGLGVQSPVGGGARFSAPAARPIQQLVQWVPVRFPGGKATGTWRLLPTRM
jgi:hypothetical protein